MAVKDVLIRLGIVEKPGSAQAASRIKSQLSVISSASYLDIASNIKAAATQMFQFADASLQTANRIKDIQQAHGVSARVGTQAAYIEQTKGANIMPAMATMMLNLKKKPGAFAGIDRKGSDYDIFSRVMDKAAQMKNTGDKVKLLTDTMGKQGKNMLALTADWKEVSSDARKYGYSEATTAAAEKYDYQKKRAEFLIDKNFAETYAGAMAKGAGAAADVLDPTMNNNTDRNKAIAIAIGAGPLAGFLPQSAGAVQENMQAVDQRAAENLKAETRLTGGM